MSSIPRSIWMQQTTPYRAATSYWMIAGRLLSKAQTNYTHVFMPPTASLDANTGPATHCPNESVVASRLSEHSYNRRDECKYHRER